MKYVKLLFATAGASMLLGALVSGASARSFSISNQSISAMWSEVTLNFGGAQSSCHLTLEGSMHSRTSAKVIGSLVGYITSATLGPCSSGTATILREALPWHVRYSGFTGALPNITSSTVHVIGASFAIREPFGVSCHIRTTAAQPGIGTFHRNVISHEITEVGIAGRIRTTECGVEGTLSSVSGVMSLLGTSNVRISVTLI